MIPLHRRLSGTRDDDRGAQTQIRYGSGIQTLATTPPERPWVLLPVRIDAIGPARLPALFHAAGCRVHLLAPPHLAIRTSRFVDRYSPIPDQPEAFAERLCRYVGQHADDYAWIQFGDETVLRAAAARSHAGRGASCLPVSRRPEAIMLMLDKLVFLPAAAKAGLPVPEFEICRDDASLAAAASRIGYPLMLKQGEGMAGAGVRFVATADEMRRIDWHCTPDAPLMVQSHVTGEVGSCEVVFDHGRPIAWISSLHRDFWPTPFSASCIRELVDLPEAETMLEGIGRLTGYHGLAGVDWIRSTGDGRLYLIELNPRPTPCYHLGPRVGVNFAQAVRALVDGSSPSIQRPRPPAPGDALVYQFPQYCFRAIDDRQFHHLPRSLGDVPWREPFLVAAHLRRVLTHYLPSGYRDKLRSWFRS